MFWRKSRLTYVLIFLIAIICCGVSTIAQEDEDSRPVLGIYLEEDESEVVVKDILPEGPADVAGFRIGDVITAIEDVPVRLETWHEVLERFEVDDMVIVSLKRNGIDQELRAVLAPISIFPTLKIEGEVAHELKKDGFAFAFDAAIYKMTDKETLVILYPLTREGEKIENAGDDGNYKDESGHLMTEATVRPESEEHLASFDLFIPYNQFPNEVITYYPHIAVFDVETARTIAEIPLRDIEVESMLGSMVIPEEGISIVANENQILQIRRIWETDEAGSTQAEEGVFLVMDATIYNYAEDERCYADHSIPAFLKQEGEEDKKILPTYMGEIRDAFYPLRNYPGTDVIGAREGPLCLKGYHKANTVLVYQLPGDLSELKMTFGPKSGNFLGLGDQVEPTEFRLWLQRQEGSEYSFAVVSVDGEAQITIVDWRLAETDIERVYDTEVVSLENCQGVASRKSTRTLTREVSITAKIEEEVFANFSIPVPIPLLNGILQTEVEKRSTTEENERLSFQISEEIEVPPGAIVNYEFVWYLVSAEGEMDAAIGDQIITIPFTLDDRIRGEVRSLPPSDCPED